jgi:hypothetical protein
MPETITRIDALSRGFRARYLRYTDLEAQMRAWAEAFPQFVRLQSIARTPEGREVFVLTIGPEPDRVRPSVWVDGNMHAMELAGSSVALSIAEDFIRLHIAPDDALHGLPHVVRERLRNVLVYVLPRMAPDGAEAVLTTGAYVRSNPRDRRPPGPKAYWRSADVDGDGLALVMRKEDPCGEYVEASEVPGLLVPRRLEDPGPYYKVYPEGFIENFDGHHIPSPHYLSDNDTDLNRNFPWSWVPDHEQVGAGLFPLSEPEARAVVEFTAQRPEIFAWLNLHCFGGVFIRPMGHKPDTKMDRDDLEVFRQVAEWGEKCTGYPTVSGYEEFTYEPDKPLHGDLTDYAYMQRGAIAYVCELWDLFARLGIPRKKPFVDHYTQLTREDFVRLGQWDAEHNAGRILRPWRPFVHPQLGVVEVGGVDPRVGIWNPPLDLLGEVCARQAAAFLRVAAMAPSVEITHASAEPLGDRLHRVMVTVENRGYLPTFILASARTLSWNEALHATLSTNGCVIVGDHPARRDLGHLEGWGRGLHGHASLFFLRSRGNTGARHLEWIVRGHGQVTVRVEGCRVGFVERLITLHEP